MDSSVASFLVPTEKIVINVRERLKNIFSGLKIHLHTYNQFSSLLLLLAWRYTRQYNDRTLLNEYASELRQFFAFSRSKSAISFNILLVLMILCLRNIYFQVSNYICIIINAVSFYYLWYGTMYKRQYTGKTLTL